MEKCVVVTQHSERWKSSSEKMPYALVQCPANNWTEPPRRWGMGSSCPLSEMEREKLQQWTAAHGTPQQVALRCRIVLAAAAGESDVAIAKQLAVNRNTVILWRTRFHDEGVD